tara:strand:+ start:130 stop:429 length:300 start_codon:yes stop_codon:yes gene_type:complete
MNLENATSKITTERDGFGSLSFKLTRGQKNFCKTAIEVAGHQDFFNLLENKLETLLKSTSLINTNFLECESLRLLLDYTLELWSEHDKFKSEIETNCPR